MMETIQEILNFSVGKLTVGNIISALVIFLVCHAVIKALMGPVERLLDKLKVDMTLRGFLRTVIRVVLNFVAVCIVAESIGIPAGSFRYVRFGSFPVRTGRFIQSFQRYHAADHQTVQSRRLYCRCRYRRHCERNFHALHQDHHCR